MQSLLLVQWLRFCIESMAKGEKSAYWKKGVGNMEPQCIQENKLASVVRQIGKKVRVEWSVCLLLQIFSCDPGVAYTWISLDQSNSQKSVTCWDVKMFFLGVSCFLNQFSVCSYFSWNMSGGLDTPWVLRKFWTLLVGQWNWFITIAELLNSAQGWG